MTLRFVLAVTAVALIPAATVAQIISPNEIFGDLFGSSGGSPSGPPPHETNFVQVQGSTSLVLVQGTTDRLLLQSTQGAVLSQTSAHLVSQGGGGRICIQGNATCSN